MGINKDLGLPFGKMEKVIFAFDVDGTLIDDKDKAYYDIVNMVKTVARFKNVKVVIWSGGGKDYAEMNMRRLQLEDHVWKCLSKLQHEELRALGYHIIAVDDIQDTAIGDTNLIVRNK
jgi:phosphoserine phosphatase